MSATVILASSAYWGGSDGFDLAPKLSANQANRANRTNSGRMPDMLDVFQEVDATHFAGPGVQVRPSRVLHLHVHL